MTMTTPVPAGSERTEHPTKGMLRVLVEHRIATERPPVMVWVVGFVGIAFVLGIWVALPDLLLSLSGSSPISGPLRLVFPLLGCVLMLAVPAFQYGLFKGRMGAYLIAVNLLTVIAVRTAYLASLCLEISPGWITVLVEEPWLCLAALTSGPAVFVLLLGRVRRWFFRCYALRRRPMTGLPDYVQLLRSETPSRRSIGLRF